MPTNEQIIRQAIGHSLFKHDLNISEDLYVIRGSEFDALADDAINEIRKQES